MFNKVNLTGVNTSKIKVLNEKEKKELLKKIKSGDGAAREEFISGNLKLVLSVIQRFANKGKNLDDLFQVGCIGLIKATDNFDTTLNVRFSTYAVPMIIGEIRRYLRDNNVIRVSRSVRDLAYKALSVRERLQKETGEEPPIKRIAGELGMPPEEVTAALDAIADPVSLFDPVYSDGTDQLMVMDSICDENSKDSNWLDEIILKDSIEDLNEREKKILSLRFFVGRTQTEVADEIGISQAQVSRLEKGALDKIKKYI